MESLTEINIPIKNEAKNPCVEDAWSEIREFWREPINEVEQEAENDS